MSQAEHSFEAGIFHPDLGNAVASGRIYFDTWSLQFESDVISVAIPMDHLTIQLGKGGADRIYFSDSGHPEIRIFTADETILNHRSIQNSRLRQQLEADASRREVSRRLQILAGFLAGCLVLTWLGVEATGLMVRALARRVPQTWLQTFGNEEITNLTAEKLLEDNTNQVAALEALAAPLLKVVADGTNEFQFYIMKAEDPNAFSLPGGQVVVTTGLLDLVNRPDELLGVFAHEMAHVTQKHHVRKIISAAGPVVIFGIFLHSRSALLNLLSEGSGLLVYEGFSQEYETEADDVGWKYLVKANIDPRGMIEVFRNLEAQEAKEKVKSDLPKAFSSHPALEQRISHLERKWNKLSRKSGFIKLDTDAWQRLKAGP